MSIPKGKREENRKKNESLSGSFSLEQNKTGWHVGIVCYSNEMNNETHTPMSSFEVVPSHAHVGSCVRRHLESGTACDGLLEVGAVHDYRRTSSLSYRQKATRNEGTEMFV